MSKEEYIKACGGKTSNDLSDDQIINYYIDGDGELSNCISALIINTGRHNGGRISGLEIDVEKAISMLREAFESNKVLEIIFIDGECFDTGDNNVSTSHYIMRFAQ